MNQWKRPFAIILLVALSVALPASLVNPVRALVASIFHPTHWLSCLAADSVRPDSPEDANAAPVAGDALLRERLASLRTRFVQAEAEKCELIRKLNSLSEVSEERLSDFPKPIVADIILPADSSPWRRSFIVNKGSTDGIRPGQAVIWRNHLVGRTSQVGPYTTRIETLADPAFKVLCTVAREEDSAAPPPQPLEGILEGRRDQPCHLKWVPRVAPVPSGSPVLVSPRDPNYPKGFVVGEVVTADIAPSGFSYSITVRPLVDIDRLTSVVILRKDAPD